MINTQKSFSFLLIILLVCIPFAIYFVDKHYFLPPVSHQGRLIIRNDSRGEGHFSARRNGRRLHMGLDLLADMGAPVLASRSGWVTAARESWGMGKYIVISHRNDIKTLYGHLSYIDVKERDFIRQGQVIGAIGKTGNANHPAILPHLHFEVRNAGLHHDPMEYLE